MLFFPYFDNILILIIVVSGLNKVDLYHVLCLFIFVAFLIRPKYKKPLTIFVIAYGMFFIMAKFTYTLISDDYILEQDTQDLLEVIGIKTVYTPENEFKLFAYEFKSQQWTLVVVGYLHYFQQRLF